MKLLYKIMNKNKFLYKFLNMKRKSVLVLCALTAMGAFAQKNLVEDVEHAIGGFEVKVDAYKKAATDILPALENAETKGDAKTWYVAGKTNFGLYDRYFSMMQLGQDVDKEGMGMALLKGYDYYMTALPLDSVKQTNKDGSYKTDKHGNVKVKTKYSKDIVNALVGHHNDFQLAGSFLYDAKKYAEACKCWEVYVSMPTSGLAEREKFLAPDSTLAQIEFFRGVSAWQGEDLKAAVSAFANARKMGYLQKEAFDYAMNCYANLNDNEGIVAVAKEAMPLFGDVDSQYINIIINDNINKGNYAEAEKLVEEAIAKNPSNAELYNVKGIMLEQKEDEEGALACFKKAVELNPEYMRGQFNAGRVLVKQAVALQSENEKLKGAEFAKMKETKVLPLYKEAMPFMEKAYQLDSTDSQIKNILSNIYYQLGLEDKLKSLGY